MEESCKNILIFRQKAVSQLLRLCGHPELTLRLVQVINRIPLATCYKILIATYFCSQIIIFYKQK